MRLLVFCFGIIALSHGWAPLAAMLMVGSIFYPRGKTK